ncbi:hypothetical protein B0H14DRAFT_3715983 [Mycena olivaceomarginata]|nr:hypothetical protein B0H14DRAFT_3715983 [Mycena olivaceomarginata]
MLQKPWKFVRTMCKFVASPNLASHLIHSVINGDALDSYPLPPSSRPAPAPVLTTFLAAMDEWQFSQPYWDGSSEAQRREPPRVGSAPAPGVLPSFGFPTDSGLSSIAATPSINLTDFGHPATLPFPDLFSGASQPAFHSDFSLPPSWDAAPFSWPAQFSQQPSETVYDPSVQPHWDDFVSSLQPAPARPPSTGSGAGDFYDGYG